MIEKGTSTLFREQSIPYSQISNDTINLITDQGALAIFVYLQSKPSNWIIRAKDVQKHFSIGRDKYRSGMRILKDLGLMETRTVHNDSGQFVDNRTVLHNTPVPELLKTRPSVDDTDERISRGSVKPTAGESTPLVIKDSLVMKDSTKTSASDDAPEVVFPKVNMKQTLAAFDQIWDKYHNKKKKKESSMVFIKVVKTMTLTELSYFVHQLENSLRSKNNENAIGWSNTLLSSYLYGECWNDEVTGQPVKDALDPRLKFINAMKQWFIPSWACIGDMDQSTQEIIQNGIDEGWVMKPENLDKLIQFGFTRGKE